MKVATILALPALAIAAATPQIKERDSVIPDVQFFCVLRITDIIPCLLAGGINDIAEGRIASCPIVTVNSVRTCLNLPPLPIPV
ncbi:hypothetical protein FDECE_2811 [Fusarium decemcellulare]|nr:hypothetical protein FDECE_2811 [Fusarium decemcellulare]